MAGTYPSFNDREFDLLKKLTANTATLADTEAGDVAKLVAGTGISISPASGTGTVTVTSTVTGTLPTQTGNSGKVLTTNGTTAAWTDSTTGVKSLTAPTGQSLTLTGGDTGASLALGAGTGKLAQLTGSLGIGTAASYKLHVDDTAGGTAISGTNKGFAYFTNSSNGNGIILGADSTTVSTINGVGGLSFWTFTGAAWAEAARFSATNRNLLIGTPTDISGSAGLKVAGTTAATNTTSGAVQIGSNIGLSGNAGGPSYFGGSLSTAGTLYGVGNLVMMGDPSAAGANIYARPGSSAYLRVDTGLGMRVESGTLNVTTTTSASSSTVGALTIGNGTAATNVAIGGGNINAGGTGMFGGSAGAAGQIGFSSINGFQLWSKAGSSYDFTLYNNGAAAIVRVPVGTQNLEIVGTSPSTGVGTGALQVAGGIYAGAASVFGSTLALSDDLAITKASSARVRLLNSTAVTGKNWDVQSFSDGNFYISHSGVLNAFTLAPTTGNATFAGAVITGSATLSGAGAIPITTSLVKYTSTGVAQALTLANGVDGQRLTIVHDVDGGSGVLTPTTKTGFSTVTFTNAGDTVDLVYVTTRGWMVTGSYLAVIAP